MRLARGASPWAIPSLTARRLARHSGLTGRRATDRHWTYSACPLDRCAMFGPRQRADVAELVDAHGSGPCGCKSVEVRVLSSASRRASSRRISATLFRSSTSPRAGSLPACWLSEQTPPPAHVLNKQGRVTPLPPERRRPQGDIIYDVMTPAELIRSTRTRLGLSQRRLALRAGTTQAAVSRIERGVVSPTFATLHELMVAMGEEAVSVIP